MKKILLFIFSFILVNGCNNNFDLKEKVTNSNLTLVNQDSVSILYPEVIKDKIAVIGFIYTHCPDICPMTAHNMELAEESLSKDELDEVKFLLISFDPGRDTPSILKQYADVRSLDMNHWELLTGKEEDIKMLLKEYDVKAFNDDTTYNEKGEPNYFMIHTDRISLVDKDGNLRKNYRGSIASPEELSKDIKNLE
ncbi:MAG TPA: SCO family protein [Ignavibacteriaceae bacterium]|nr:SCO family protein [Ignavibacteriaceae bacterium]